MVLACITASVSTESIDIYVLAFHGVAAMDLDGAINRTKIKMCEAIIKGTKKVGSKLNGNSRKAAIDCQSCNPKRRALKATNTMSIKPKKFQIRRTICHER